jgi:hypothetical protein
LLAAFAAGSACGNGANVERSDGALAVPDGGSPVDARSSDDAAPPIDGGPWNVVVTLDPSHKIGTSNLVTGYTQVDNSLNYPWRGNDQSAVDAARGLLPPAIGAFNQFVMAWGAPDPWPDPISQPDLSAFTKQLDVLKALGGDLVVSLCEAPWWMKGTLQSDGSTALLTQADEWSNAAYAARVLDNMMDKWLTLVRATAQAAMAPPYSVRRFQVWNELKGYYDPMTNAWDYTTSAGDPSGPNAKHGYTFFYNQTYAALKQVATNLGIAPNDVWVGGPYVVMDSGRDAAHMSNPSSVTGPWGVLDQRALDVISYWLTNKTGAEFIAVDGGGDVKFGSPPADDFTEMRKFAAVDSWIRSQPNGGATLPIWWAEWYAAPYALPKTPEVFAAIKAYALMQNVLGGAADVLEWGGLGVDGPNGVDGLFTPTTAVGGGQPTPWYAVYKGFRAAFSEGAELVEANASNGDIAVLATPETTLLVNKTSSTLRVLVGRRVVVLAPYQVYFMPTP